MDVLNATAQNRLKTIIARVERLLVEKADVMAAIAEVFAEAKGEGFDTKICRKVIRIRAQDKAKRLEEEAITDLYLSALGDLSESFTPQREAKPPAEDEDLA